jgi:carbonic anhydrase
MPKQSVSVYQSPISLHHADAVKIKQTIDVYGRNDNAIFNTETKNFEVQTKIIITLNNKQYKLDEYHFHIPSEHKVNGKCYEAEIHYVFIEYDKVAIDSQRKCSNICHCECEGEGNATLSVFEEEKTVERNDVVVIGRVILNAGHYKDLKNIQVKVPHYYYQYDGTLTTGNYSPVRWIIGETPIHYDFAQLVDISKKTRSLQDLDGRIVLYSEKK